MTALCVRRGDMSTQLATYDTRYRATSAGAARGTGWIGRVAARRNALLVTAGACLMFVSAFAGYIITEPVTP
jgi:hypothetical protein